MPLSPSNIEVDFDNAKAEMDIDDLAVEDYFNLINALIRQGGLPNPPRPPEVEASVKFRITWHGVNQSVPLRSAGERFVGDFILDTSQIAWHDRAAAGATTPEFRFFSTGKSTNEFSLLGHERNGSFFT